MDLIKYEELKELDLCVREVQIRIDTVRKYEDCLNIIEYNKYLETFRSEIHSTMDYILKNT